ncbi:MAG: alpha/beta hydrolase [Janthinobacterium lividum]
MTIVLDAADLADARRFNRKLGRFPRFRIRHQFQVSLIQSLLRLSQMGGNRTLRRSGLRVNLHLADADGRRVPVRILRPDGEVKGIVLDIHGGGWALGNTRMNDHLNAAMVRACGVAVMSVEYRLAGPTPVSGLIDDCVAAARWLLRGGLPEWRGLPVVVVGESAGAHLAAAMLLRLKAWPELLGRVAGVVLYYGVYDLAGTPSVRKAGPETLVLHGPGLLTDLRRLTPGLSDEERRDPALSPLYGDLRDLPPALMVTGTLDPLRDDTLELSERWRLVGDVEMHLLPESPHGFVHFSTATAAKVLQRSHEWISERISKPRQPASQEAARQAGQA